MNRIVITRIEHHGQTFLAYLVFDEQRTLLELQLFEAEEDTLFHRIYVGYVEKIVPNISAAFVRIADHTKCYLPLSDVKHPIYAKRQSSQRVLCEGDEIIVQVTRDALKTKDAIVSTRLTLHGNYCFLTTENLRLGVSQKIAPEASERLYKLLEDTCRNHEEQGYGLVLRTHAQTASREDLISDIQHLVSQYRIIMEQGIHKARGTCLFSPMPAYLYRLKSVDYSKVDRILTDQRDLFEAIKTGLPMEEADEKLVFYQEESISLGMLYQFRKHLDQLTQNQVWLDSGANIIIECLETLTVIDVNSGKNTSKKEDTLFQINLEAAKELCRQLRLRNISGMILVDFINMSSGDQERNLIAFLKQELSKDPVKACFVDITKLGIVEITRKKERKSLREVLGDR